MAARQRIIPVRREYNRWVANQTLEDYALRFTAKSARQFSSQRISQTAIGAISFLALEAIGGAITLSYGTTNAFYAIIVASIAMLAIGLADQPVRHPTWSRYRPSDPGRRLRLYRFDHHVADLCQLHLHAFRYRGVHHVGRVGADARHTPVDRLYR